MRRRLLRRILVWAIVGATAAAAALAIATSVLLRPAHIKHLLLTGLTRHLNLDATIDDVSISLLPRPMISGTHLVLRLPHRPDLPPFISIDHFSVGASVFDVIRKHVTTVHADGLRIAVPPGDSLDALSNGDDPSGGGNFDNMTDIIVDHLVTHDAQLTFVRSKPQDMPLVFALYELSVHQVGFGRRMPFDVRLRNPVPDGQVQATGVVGPWRRDLGSLTPVSGQYTFANADLSTINGIGGTLQSRGAFAGNLTAISVNGTATVPDFSLDLGGKPVPLTTSFSTVVNGTNGTTELRRVDATLGQTVMVVTGAITNLPGPGQHDVNLQVGIDHGRVEDVLALVIDSPKPVMTGDIALNAAVALPPGASRVQRRLRVSGRFKLAQIAFTDEQVRQKLRELSRRSQGKSQDDPMGRVLTNLRGQFAVGRGVADIRDFTFEIPGAAAHLNGTYGLGDGALDLHGTLAMQTTASKAIGGFKSIFVWPFNGLFKRDGAGAVLPIKITGTRKNPQFGLEIGKIFKRH